MSGSDADCTAPFIEQRPRRVAVVLNPQSGNGRAERQWRRIEPRVAQMLPEYEVLRTKSPGEGTQLTRDALRAGFDRIVSAGGDGTHFEVVNGFFDGDAPVNPRLTAAYAAAPAGNATTWSIASRMPMRSPIAWSWCEGTSDSTRVPETSFSV